MPTMSAVPTTADELLALHEPCRRHELVRRSRVPPPGPGYFPGAPDLAVEVVSASDRATSLAAKTRLWLAHGATTVWIVDTAARTVAIHRRDEPPHLLHENDILTASDQLPGFVTAVRDLFPVDPT